MSVTGLPRCTSRQTGESVIMGASVDPQESSEAWLSSAEQVQDTPSATIDAIKHRARHIAEQQKAAGADQIEGVARAMDGAANQLRGQMPTPAKYIDGVAGQVSAMTSALGERSVDEIRTLLSLRRWYWG
jgi:hypothetical protein